MSFQQSRFHLPDRATARLEGASSSAQEAAVPPRGRPRGGETRDVLVASARFCWAFLPLFGLSGCGSDKRRLLTFPLRPRTPHCPRLGDGASGADGRWRCLGALEIQVAAILTHGGEGASGEGQKEAGRSFNNGLSGRAVPRDRAIATFKEKYVHVRGKDSLSGSIWS